MAGLVIHPDDPKRFWGFTVPTAIVVDVNDDGYVLVAIEQILTPGDDLERVFTPDEARALAAALCHQADVVERRRS